MGLLRLGLLRLGRLRMVLLGVQRLRRLPRRVLLLGLVVLGLGLGARRRWRSRCGRGLHMITMSYHASYHTFPPRHTDCAILTTALAMQALLRAIKDEQGKSRGTRDALQRSMLC